MIPITTLDDVPKLPTRRDAIAFRSKAAILQMRRMFANMRQDGALHTKGSAAMETQTDIVAISKTALWTDAPANERFLIAGKIQNLRIAAATLNGIIVPAGKVFSFWNAVGRTTRRRGYVRGRELREGCIIPNIGGGLCQLSNALYDAALQAGFEIVERHAHTRVVPGSLAEAGRDATVFWNYVDLRFRSPFDFRIEARLDSTNLTVAFHGKRTPLPKLHSISSRASVPDVVHSCASCETEQCHRVLAPGTAAKFESSAYLLDEFVPEFDGYIQTHRSPDDRLFIPLDGRRFGKANYGWTTAGFASVRQSPVVTAKRSYRSRKLSAQGAARQRNLLRMYEELAKSYAKQLTADVLHVTVHQNLLPYLWKNGHLGGRTFDVLMTIMPMSALQKVLDAAAVLHPESRTLSDFRADPDLVAIEDEALRAADRIVTPHRGIAGLFGSRAELLEWQLPKGTAAGPERKKNSRPNIVFPATTVGRKGCYELREALRDMDVSVTLLGPLIEGPDFWARFDTVPGGENWLETADVVVLPAWVEHRPRRLLHALANGVPVIATPACGIGPHPGLTLVNTGDTAGLRECIRSSIGRRDELDKF